MGWDDEKILTTRELAEKLRVDDETLYRWDLGGILHPTFRLPGRGGKGEKRYIWGFVRKALGIPNLPDGSKD